jgi:hypothetical protein
MKMKTLFQKLSVLCFFFFSWTLIHAQCLQNGITFSTQTEINDFQTNYPGCHYVLGDVTIEEVSSGSITDLSGLSVLDTIGGSLVVNSNSALVSLNGLNSLTKVFGDLKIIDNDNINTLFGLGNVSEVGINLIIENNMSLSSLSGLGNLTEIGGSFVLTDCSSLSDLDGIENLASIEGFLVIKSNANLSTLTGLGGATEIAGGLTVEDNDMLTELTGLHNIDPQTITNLTIKDNAMLSMCEVESVCGYLAGDDSADISDNATGCNSVSEVKTACTAVSIDDLMLNKKRTITVFPNPTTGIFRIDVEDLQGCRLSILNTTGTLVQEIQFLNSEQVDLTGLSNGLYFLELRNSDKRLVGVAKIIKE